MIEVECRTCLEMTDLKKTVSITKKFLMGKSFKEVILLFVPQMVTAIWIDDRICFICTETLYTFSMFIERCCAVQKILINRNKNQEENFRRNKEVDSHFNKSIVTSTEELNSEYLLHPYDKNVNKTCLQLKPIQELREQSIGPLLKSSLLSEQMNSDSCDKYTINGQDYPTTRLEFSQEKWVECMTCLEMSDLKSSSSITQEFLLDKTFKEVILQFVPQMVTEPWVNDIVCFKCSETLHAFAKFIYRCIEVENVFLEISKQKYIEKYQLIKAKEFPGLNLLNSDNENTLEDIGQDASQSNFRHCKPIRTYSRKFRMVNQNAKEEFVDKENFVGSSVQPLFNITRVNNTYAVELVGRTTVSTECESIKEEDLEEPIFKVTKVNKTYSRDMSKMKLLKDPLLIPSLDARIDEIVESLDTVKPTDRTEKGKCEYCDGDVSSDHPNNMTVTKKCKKCYKSDINCQNSLTVLPLSDARIDEIVELPEIIEETNRTENGRCESCDTDVSSVCLDNMTMTMRKKWECLLMQQNNTQPATFDVSHQGSTAHNDVILKPVTEDQGPTEKDGDDNLKTNEIAENIIKGGRFCDYDIRRHNRVMSIRTNEVPLKFLECLSVSNINLYHYGVPKELENKRILFFGSVVVQCSSCKLTFPRHAIHDHYKNIHGMNIPRRRYKSSYDYILRINSEDESNQTKIHNKNKQKQVKKKKFVSTKHLCPICGKMTTQFHAHMNIHEPNYAKRYMCHKCPKFYKRPECLTHHLANRHANKKFECPECKKICSSTSALREHCQLKHSNIRRHTCRICGQQFLRGDYFRRHMNSHALGRRVGKYTYRSRNPSNTDLLKCKYCPKAYKTVHTLRHHVLNHLQTERYKCKICHLTFSNRSNRYRHEKKHEDPTFALCCKICWNRVKTKEDLIKHMKKHDSTRKYKCHNCEASYSRKYLLSQHVYEKHTTAEDNEEKKEAFLKEALQEFFL